MKLVDGLSPAAQAAVIARHGAVEQSAVAALRIHVAQVPAAGLAQALQAFAADPQVESVEAVKTRRAEWLSNDPYVGGQWSLARIGWPTVYSTLRPTGSATVALLDTGVDGSHPDLQGNLSPGTSLLDDGDGLTDPAGHGTQLAGLIAAVADNQQGIAGVAFSGVKVMPVRVLDAAGVGQDSAIIAGIVWAADHGADVILMGFGNPDYSPHLQDAIDYAWSKGAVLVAAAGNAGATTPSYPAANRAVIGIAASDPADRLAGFSNRGSDVFLAAPGTELATTDRAGGYATVSGTSPAAALVAGAAALLKAAEPTLTNGQVLGRLARGAAPVADPQEAPAAGFGRVDLAAALADTGTEELAPLESLAGVYGWPTPAALAAAEEAAAPAAAGATDPAGGPAPLAPADIPTDTPTDTPIDTGAAAQPAEYTAASSDPVLPNAPVDNFPVTNDTVYAVAVDSTTGITYIGGEFTTVTPKNGSSSTRNGLAAFAADGTLTDWNPNVGGGGVYALAVSAQTVYVGGYFSTIGSPSTPRQSLAAIGTDGRLADWNPSPDSSVLAVAVSGQTVYVGGFFSTIGSPSTPRQYLAAIAANGTATPWNPNPNSGVWALAVGGTTPTLYVGGAFTTMGPSATVRNRLAAFDIGSGALSTNWDPNVIGNGYAMVRALAVSGSIVYAGGYFTTVKSFPRNNLAAIDTTSGIPTDWNPNVNADVLALAVSGTTVYAGGQFTTIGGTTTRDRLAAIDATGKATNWNPNAGSGYGEFDALAVNGTALYVGGYFPTIGGIPRPNLAKFQPSIVSTTTTVAATPNPAAYGAPVTLTATLSPTAATGSVTFKDGTTTLGTDTLAGGNATYVTSALTVGGHSITAVYAGDTGYDASTSDPSTLTIDKADQTISFANPGTKTYGTSPTLTATATSALAVSFSSTTPPVCTVTSGGLLTFGGVGPCTIAADQGGNDNYNPAPPVPQTFTVAKADPSVSTWPTAGAIHYGQTLADSTLSGGSATPAGGFAFTTLGTAPPVGTASQGVTFTPTDTEHYNTAAGAVSVTVNKAESTALLAADPNPATLGQPVQLTATVSAVGGSGTVTFMDGGATLGTGPLSGGTATLNTSALTAGSHSLTAVYSGDANYQGATSPDYTQTVQVPVTIATNPAGLTVTVDGTDHPAPYSTAWTPGASHQLAVPQYQGGTGGTRAAFAAWSDGGALSHTVTAPAAAAAFTAAFATQYQLTTAAAPASGGLIAPATGGWFAAGTTVPVTLYPVVGYALASWTVNGTTTETAVNTQPVLMSGPMSVTAILAGAQPVLTAGVTGARTGTKPLRTWTLTLTNRTTATGPAPSPRFDSLTLTQTFPAGGPACTPVVGTLPTLTGPLAVGATLSGTVGIDFTDCNASARFQATLRYSDGGRAAGLSTLNNQPQ